MKFWNVGKVCKSFISWIPTVPCEGIFLGGTGRRENERDNDREKNIERERGSKTHHHPGIDIF